MYFLLIFDILLLQHIDANHICTQQDFPRVKKFESKPFILFPVLASLYEGMYIYKAIHSLAAITSCTTTMMHDQVYCFIWIR